MPLQIRARFYMCKFSRFVDQVSEMQCNEKELGRYSISSARLIAALRGLLALGKT